MATMAVQEEVLIMQAKQAERSRCAKVWSAMLREMATSMICTCKGDKFFEPENHDYTCPHNVTARNALAVERMGE
jgi:hypothetical protein